jgi:hypothetical protein
MASGFSEVTAFEVMAFIGCFLFALSQRGWPPHDMERSHKSSAI